MHRTRVKICGITRLEDALLACELGADAIGLVMTPSSPRCVSIERARAIREALPAFVSAVAVVVDPQSERLGEILSRVAPHLIQFHGNEAPGYCDRFGSPYIKALSMNESTAGSLESRVADYGNAAAILLDGRVVHDRADGRSFDWRIIPARPPRPVILAGGIDETNVASAIEQVAPYAVDTSSGVESAPGIKDHAKLVRFFRAVSDADSRRRGEQ